ncbi:uncharacterized protein LOC144481750 [Mustelus asterias]
MKSVSLLLLVCLCARELGSTKLNNGVLRTIVKDFQKAKEGNRNQFSFLIALNPEQCLGQQKILYLSNGTNTSPPKIANSLNEFREPLNYLAVYPDSGKQCSEFKILFQDRDGKLTSEWFAEKINALSAGGCVIFYTTNTPCTEKCFSGKWMDISCPLLFRPFRDWKSEGQHPIHKYFVYTQVYSCDENNTNVIIQGFNRLNAPGNFLFRKCEENKACEKCARENNYCVK